MSATKQRKSEIEADLKADPADPRYSFFSPMNTKSVVWKNFELVKFLNVQEDFARCKTCTELLSYSARRGTGSLLRHSCTRRRDFGLSAKTVADRALKAALNAEARKIKSETDLMDSESEIGKTKVTTHKSSLIKKKKKLKGTETEQLLLEDVMPQVYDVESAEKRIKFLQVEIEEKKLKAVEEETDYKRKVYQAKLEAQNAKKQYYEYMLNTQKGNF